MYQYAEKAAYAFEPVFQEPRSYTVSEVNRLVAGSLRNLGQAGRISVTGELGSVSFKTTAQGSRIVYCSLKEGDECLSCVAFEQSLSRMLRMDALTGEVFDPPRLPRDVFADGRKVLLDGVLGVYSKGRSSTYQLNIFSVTDIGAGDRARKLKELTSRLAKEGFFLEERKRPLPPNPSCVAVVTSPTGAVIHDFLRTAKDRGTGTRMILYPVPVQGTGAAAMIAEAVEAAGHDGRSQVVVVIRGGGSEEDLACFNEEVLARAVYACPVPVVAGIGHESDHCLTDMTADRRAPTPTAAAQYLWTPKSDLRDELDVYGNSLAQSMRHRLDRAEDVLAHYEKLVRSLEPSARLKEQQRQAEELSCRLHGAMQRLLADCGAKVDQLAEKAGLSMDRLVEGSDLQLAREDQALKTAGVSLLARGQGELDKLSLKLEGLNPLAPLQRGYAYLEDDKGHVVRSVAALSAGQRLVAHVADGAIAARVEDVRPMQPEAAGAGKARKA